MSTDSCTDVFDVLARIFDLRERRSQDVRPAVQLMLGLDPDDRALVRDCQVLLGHEGLPALRRERLRRVEDVSPLQADPEDALPEADVAPVMEALQLGGSVRRLFPDLRTPRWQIARALMKDPAAFQASLADALRSRRPEGARRSVEEQIAKERPVWIDRAGALRAACLNVLRGIGDEGVDTVHEAAERLFELFAACDRRAMNLLWALDTAPDDAVRQVTRLHEVASASGPLPADALPLVA